MSEQQGLRLPRRTDQFGDEYIRSINCNVVWLMKCNSDNSGTIYMRGRKREMVRYTGSTSGRKQDGMHVTWWHRRSRHIIFDSRRVSPVNGAWRRLVSLSHITRHPTRGRDHRRSRPFRPDRTACVSPRFVASLARVQSIAGCHALQFDQKQRHVRLRPPTAGPRWRRQQRWRGCPHRSSSIGSDTR